MIGLFGLAASRPLVGVDIGATSIKVCQLEKSRRGYELARFGYQPLEPQTIVDRHVINPQAVIEGLSRAFGGARIRQREVALSVSGQSVISRKITVPIMTTGELDEQIQWEAENHIPFDIKEVYVAYEVLRRRPEAGQMDLLLVAAKREEINDYVQIARQAKLKPVVVDIDAFTIQNLFEHNLGNLPADQTLAIINVGATQASINIISRGTSAFTRDIAQGGNHLTEHIIKQLGLPFEQAEELKVQASLGPNGAVPARVFEVIDQVSDTIAGEIQRSLDFFLATSGEERIARVFLTGGSANLGQLTAAIQRRSRVAVEVLQPLARIGVESREINRELLTRRASQLSVALGLSLRETRERRA
jgi:type IV pilus assembly protein PilM